MSRIGRMPIIIPTGVKVQISGITVTSNGPKGELKRDIHPEMSLNLQDDVLTVTRPSESRQHRALHGLTRTLIFNMVEGVSKGFNRDLEIVGVGYRAQQVGENVTLTVGFTHSVTIEPMPGLTLTVQGTNMVRVSGANKEAVGEMAARIRRIRPPDAYKGKGIRYAGQTIKLKPGKAGKAIGSK